MSLNHSLPLCQRGPSPKHKVRSERLELIHVCVPLVVCIVCLVGDSTLCSVDGPDDPTLDVGPRLGQDDDAPAEASARHSRAVHAGACRNRRRLPRP